MHKGEHAIKVFQDYQKALVKAEVDLRPGGMIRFEWGPGLIEVGKILVCESPHRLSYTWEALEPSPTTIVHLSHPLL